MILADMYQLDQQGDGWVNAPIVNALSNKTMEGRSGKMRDCHR